MEWLLVRVRLRLILVIRFWISFFILCCLLIVSV